MGHGYALWLLPEPRSFERLSAVIAEIARAEGSPRFEPHVTLVSGIALEAGEVMERARGLASALTPRDVLLARAAQRPDFFQALFLAVEGGDLHGAHRRAAAEMGVTPSDAYRPHVSLLYGDFPAPTKSAILDHIGRHWNEACLLDRLAVVTPEGPPASWVRQRTWPLGAP
jgi:Cyclic phosphodiesterase-like protein